MQLSFLKPLPRIVDSSKKKRKQGLSTSSYPLPIPSPKPLASEEKVVSQGTQVKQPSSVTVNYYCWPLLRSPKENSLQRMTKNRPKKALQYSLMF